MTKLAEELETTRFVEELVMTKSGSSKGDDVVKGGNRK